MSARVPALAAIAGGARPRWSSCPFGMSGEEDRGYKTLLRQTPGLFQSFPKDDTGGHRDVEGASRRGEGNRHTGVGGVVDIFRDACRFTAEQQDVFGAE